MRITGSSLNLSAAHEQTRTHVRNERLEVWVGSRGGAAAPPAAPPAPAATVQLAAPEGGTGAAGCAPGTDGGAEAAADSETDRHMLDLMLLLRAFEHLDGEGKGKARHGRGHGEGQGHDREHAARMRRGARDIQAAYATPAAQLPPGPRAPSAAPAQPVEAGWGMVYRLEETHTEVERSAFAATGKVTTADGRQIDFAVKLEQERVQVQSRNVEVLAGDAKKVDPLVLNLAGGAAGFDGRHDFDLDGDGTTESVARLAGGGAYLALDDNGNGRIDSGRELFGPRTGSGFGELAVHDGDGNGWIDEADAVWANLRLWRPDAGTGAGSLTTLAAAGVGAIATASAATPFQVRQADPGQAAAGVVAHVAHTGVYLDEQGQAGTVQHVDLVIG